MGEVRENVEAVRYLESAAFVTDETLHIDGGAHAGHRDAGIRTSACRFESGYQTVRNDDRIKVSVVVRRATIGRIADDFQPYD
jgi:hypothetical protein